MDRVRAASGGQKPTAPTTRLMRKYCVIDGYYDTRIKPRCTMGRAEVLEASLHLGTGPGQHQGGSEDASSTDSSRSAQSTRIW